MNKFATKLQQHVCVIVCVCVCKKNMKNKQKSDVAYETDGDFAIRAEKDLTSFSYFNIRGKLSVIR